MSESPDVSQQVADELHEISSTLKMMLAVMMANAEKPYSFGPTLSMLYGDDHENTGTTTEYRQIADGIDGYDRRQ